MAPHETRKWDTNDLHGFVEVWFVSFGAICHQRELRDAEHIGIEIFDARFPHRTGGIIEDSQ